MAGLEAVALPASACAEPDDEPQADTTSDRAANEKTANCLGANVPLPTGEVGIAAGGDPG